MPWEPVPHETPFDPSELKKSLRGIISTREQLNDLEAENIRKALKKYLGSKPTRKGAPFHLAWAQKLHKEMFGEVLDRAGKFRKENRNIGLEWHQIEASLHNLLEDLRAWEASGMDLLEQATRLHHRAVSIRPFSNGNGRWSRMLGNIWLRLHGQAHTEWPDDVIGAESPVREEYIAAIKAADNGAFEPLLDLQRRYTANS